MTYPPPALAVLGVGTVIAVRARPLLHRALRRVARRGDRGDVPGWVLVTLMTAGLVLVLWGVARDRLTAVFNDAIDGVLGGP